jgi:rRNA-processing protein FCF1
LLVLIDTSALLYLSQKPSTFLDELEVKLGTVELAVPDSVFSELRRLAGGKGKKAKEAKMALTFASGLRPLAQGGPADDALVILAQREGAVVATLDGGLAAALRRRGVIVATVRRDRLVLQGTG